LSTDEDRTAVRGWQPRWDRGRSSWSFRASGPFSQLGPPQSFDGSWIHFTRLGGADGKVGESKKASKCYLCEKSAGVKWRWHWRCNGGGGCRGGRWQESRCGSCRPP